MEGGSGASYVALYGANDNAVQSGDFFWSIENPPVGIWFTLEGQSTAPFLTTTSMRISVESASPTTVFIDDLWLH